MTFEEVYQKYIYYINASDRWAERVEEWNMTGKDLVALILSMVLATVVMVFLIWVVTKVPNKHKSRYLLGRKK